MPEKVPESESFLPSEQIPGFLTVPGRQPKEPGKDDHEKSQKTEQGNNTTKNPNSLSTTVILKKDWTDETQFGKQKEIQKAPQFTTVLLLSLAQTKCCCLQQANLIKNLKKTYL